MGRGEGGEGGGGAGRGGVELSLQTQAPLGVGLDCSSPDGNGQSTLRCLQMLVSLPLPSLRAADCVPGLHRPCPCSNQPLEQDFSSSPPASRQQTEALVSTVTLCPRDTLKSASLP